MPGLTDTTIQKISANKIERLVFWGHDGSLQDFESCIDLIKQNISVTSISVSYIDTVRINMLLKALKSNHTLRELTISDITLDTDGINALTDLIMDNRSLQTLVVRTYMGAGGVVAIANALKHTLKHNTHTVLKKLDLSSNACGNDGAIALAEMLETNTTLEDLDLTGNNIEGEGGVALANVLKINRTLRKISLSSNYMDTDTIKLIADMLKINSRLQHIAFGVLSDTNVQEIADALKINTALQQIDFVDLTHYNLEQLAKALQDSPDTALRKIHFTSYSGILSRDSDLTRDSCIEVFETLLATNYTICDLTSSDGDPFDLNSRGLEIKTCLERNRAIQTCVQLMEASGDLKLGKLQDALNALTTAVPGLLNSPAEVPPYIADVYQMMLATMYAVDGQPGEALFLLEGLIANENTRFSEKALQMIPIMLMAKLTTQPLSATETAACCLWLAYISRDEPQSLDYRYALVKLQNQNPDMSKIETLDFLELTGAEHVINYDDLYAIGKDALASLHDQAAPEAQLLAALLAHPDYDALVVGFLFQSPAFLKVLQGRYPNIERCRVLENYLLYPRNTGEGVKIFPIPKPQEIAGFEFNERLVQAFTHAYAAEQRADNTKPSFSSILQIAKQQSYTEPTSDRVEEFKHSG